MASGNSAQIMWGVESTPGVYVAPTAANPLLPGESLTIEQQVLKSGAIIAGKRFPTSDQVNGGNIVVSGEFQVEVYNRGLGKLMRLWTGACNTTGSGPYTHVFTAGDPTDDAMTIQVGLPSSGGTIHPKSLSGCMADSFSIAGKAGEIVTAGTSIVGMKGHIGSRTAADGTTTNSSTTVTSAANAAFTQADVGKPISGTGIPAGAYITAVASGTSCTISAAATASATVTITIGLALASASYLSTQLPYKFSHGSLSLFGSSIANCSAFTIDGANNLAKERRFMSKYAGQALEGGLREYTGTLTLEFDSIAQLERMAAGTEGALSLALTSGADSATIAGNIHYSPWTPTVTGRDILTQEIPFEFIGSSTDASAFTMTIINADSAA